MATSGSERNDILERIFGDVKTLPKDATDLELTDARVAGLLDEADPLGSFRREFKLPTNRGIKAMRVKESLRTS